MISLIYTGALLTFVLIAGLIEKIMDFFMW